MSEEQKEGIVVNPFHKQGAEAPQGGEQGNAQASSVVTSGDATPPSQPPSPSENSAPASQSSQTATAATTASGESSSSLSPASGLTGFIQKIEGAAEQVIEKVESVVEGAVQEVKDFVAPSTSQPAVTPVVAPQTPPAPIVTGGLVNGNVVNPVASLMPQQPTGIKGSPSPHTNAIGTRDMSLKVEMTPEAPAPVVKEEAAVLPAVQTGITEVDQIVAGLMKNASLEAKIIINTITEYIVKMKPGKPIAQKDGVMQQVGFYNALLGAINNLEADFRPTMQAILALLHHHREGAFKETHVFRFVEHIPLSTEHRFGFRKIITLLKTLANPATRQDLLRQIHFEQVTKYGLTERGRVKLAAFFGK
jgi:hypothetical protein